MSSTEANSSTSQFQEFAEFSRLLEEGFDCPHCGEELPSQIHIYQHDGGIPVPHRKGGKYWVYTECRNKKCKIQWAWWKILRRAGKPTSKGSN